MNWLRRFFQDTNEKVSCADCGKMILRQTAKDTGGFCIPCGRMGAERRDERRAFGKRIADGSQFHLSDAERMSARALTIDVAPDQWVAHLEDVPHVEGKTVMSVVQMAKDGVPSIHLRGPDDRYLSLEQKSEWAVLTHFSNTAPEICFAHGPMAASHQIAKEDHLWLACPCCGQGSICAPSKFHLPIHAALAALDHILAGRAPAHMHWITSGNMDDVGAGRG